MPVAINNPRAELKNYKLRGNSRSWTMQITIWSLVVVLVEEVRRAEVALLSVAFLVLVRSVLIAMPLAIFLACSDSGSS